MTHGLSGYRQGCRCDTCRTEASAYQLALQQRRRDQGIQPPVHGTLNGYNNYRCRCDACKAAYREWQQAYRGAAMSKVKISPARAASLARGDVIKVHGRKGVITRVHA